MKKALCVSAILALCGAAIPAHADSYTYTCRANGKSLPLTVDDTKHVLQWRGKDYTIKDAEGCARMGWRAESNGEAFNFCVATQGYADFEENGQQVQCDQSKVKQVQSQAVQKWAKNCFLRVDGKTYLDQECFFSSSEDGSFMIGGTFESNGDGRMPFFAAVNMSGRGTADGFWNADASSTHAQTPLGKLVRDRSDAACWKNARARVCAR